MAPRRAPAGPTLHRQVAKFLDAPPTGARGTDARGTGARGTGACDAMTGIAQDQMNRASAALFGGYDQITAIGESRIDALTQSGEAAARGMECIGKAWLELGQRSMHDTEAAVRALAGAHTVQDLIGAQAQLARVVLDRMLGDPVRMAELSAKVANEAASPLRALYGGIFDRMPGRSPWRPAA